jgi:CRISPR/Cas system-associated exonuclease Cas4 (RecB family)
VPSTNARAYRTWVSATDLAEYAYCPRAHYYRHHPPPGGADPESQRRSAAGELFHARSARQVGRSERLGVVGYALLAAGAILLIGLLLVLVGSIG